MPCCACRLAEVLSGAGVAPSVLDSSTPLTTILAIGSNAGPEQLARKFPLDLFPQGVVVPVRATGTDGQSTAEQQCLIDTATLFVGVRHAGCCTVHKLERPSCQPRAVCRACNTCTTLTTAVLAICAPAPQPHHPTPSHPALLYATDCSRQVIQCVLRGFDVNCTPALPLRQSHPTPTLFYAPECSQPQVIQCVLRLHPCTPPHHINPPHPHPTLPPMNAHNRSFSACCVCTPAPHLHPHRMFKTGDSVCAAWL